MPTNETLWWRTEEYALAISNEDERDYVMPRIIAEAARRERARVVEMMKDMEPPGKEDIKETRDIFNFTYGYCTALLDVVQRLSNPSNDTAPSERE